MRGYGRAAKNIQVRLFILRSKFTVKINVCRIHWAEEMQILLTAGTQKFARIHCFLQTQYVYGSPYWKTFFFFEHYGWLCTQTDIFYVQFDTCKCWKTYAWVHADVAGSWYTRAWTGDSGEICIANWGLRRTLCWAYDWLRSITDNSAFVSALNA